MPSATPVARPTLAAPTKASPRHALPSFFRRDRQNPPADSSAIESRLNAVSLRTLWSRAPTKAATATAASACDATRSVPMVQRTGKLRRSSLGTTVLNFSECDKLINGNYNYNVSKTPVPVTTGVSSSVRVKSAQRSVPPFSEVANLFHVRAKSRELASSLMAPDHLHLRELQTI
ncbi:hypothetical protein HDU84_004344 [Entophlyctis sp. JEL0112]|nr:hypothetical protein HDU84_004344 [Entophlyctis sp. JEL0112]